jgi:hypothetical protein
MPMSEAEEQYYLDLIDRYTREAGVTMFTEEEVVAWADKHGLLPPLSPEAVAEHHARLVERAMEARRKEK